MKNANAIRNFGDLVETIFDGRFSPVFKEEHSNYKMQPPVNIYEMDNEFHIEVMAPGISKEAIRLQVIDNMLTLSFEKSEPAKEVAGKMLRNEFSVRSFKRSFTLGETVDATKINASYEQGILKVTLPKKELAKPQQIEITIQ